MTRLFENIKRMWKSLRGIFSPLMGKITKGTSTAVRATGGAVGVALSAIVIIGIIIVIALVAIPYGAFAAGTNQNTYNEIETRFCKECGQANVVLFRQDDDSTICGDCLRAKNVPATN